MDIKTNDSIQRTRYEDISVSYDEMHGQDRPYLDRNLTPVQEAALSDHQRFWRENGYLILPKFMPDDVIDAYCAVRAKCQGGLAGWAATPYEHYSEIRDFSLYRPFVEKFEELLFDKPLLHANLTGWISSERDWHQDDYLNPSNVKSSYCAVWAALEDIHHDSGPFEYVPGSHRWPTLSPDKIRSRLTPYHAAQWGLPGHDGHWAEHSQEMCSQATNEYIEKRGAKVERFIAKRGDILIWHGCLLHRGTEPNVRGMLRKTLISHYSGVTNRTDYPAGDRREHESGGFYQKFGRPLNFSGLSD